MAKLKKIICVVLVLTLMATTLMGCALFTSDETVYQTQVGIKVGNETISIARYIDALNSTYSNYYYYVAYGYMTMSDVATIAYSSLVNTYLIVDNYKATAGSDKLFNHAYASVYENAKYLSEEDVLYVLKYVKYSLFSALDSAVQTELEKIFAIGDATADDNTTVETGKIDSMAQQNIKPTDLEAINKYLNTTQDKLDMSKITNVDGYIFSSSDNAELVARVAELNERITLKEGQKALTEVQYIRAQRVAMENMLSNLKTNYGMTTDQYMKNQIEDTLLNRLANVVASNIQYEKFEKDTNALLATLKARYAQLIDSTKDEYTINPASYEYFVANLKDTSFIYNIPTNLKESYIFVKNCLIPFSEAEKTDLKAKKTELKDDEAAYIDYRGALAAGITVMNPNGSGTVLKNIFNYNSDLNAIAINQDTELYTLVATCESRADFLDIMSKYNTDTAQDGKKYDYVARIGDLPSSYTSPWVKEFQAACQEAYELGKGHVAMTVSDYGVHIVYYVDYVTESEPLDLTLDKIYTLDTPEYEFFKSYFTSVANTVTTDYLANLKKEYGTKISITNDMKKVLDSYSITLKLD